MNNDDISFGKIFPLSLSIFESHELESKEFIGDTSTITSLKTQTQNVTYIFLKLNAFSEIETLNRRTGLNVSVGLKKNSQVNKSIC